MERMGEEEEEEEEKRTFHLDHRGCNTDEDCTRIVAQLGRRGRFEAKASCDVGSLWFLRHDNARLK